MVQVTPTLRVPQNDSGLLIDLPISPAKSSYLQEVTTLLLPATTSKIPRAAAPASRQTQDFWTSTWAWKWTRWAWV